MSAVVNTAAACVAVALLLFGFPRFALIFGIVQTQLWRFFSEFLRDDDRGSGKISPYQKMSLVGCAWGIAAAFIFGGNVGEINLAAGLGILSSSATILALQILFFVVLIYTGLSRMTESSTRFFVRRDRI